MEKKIGNYSFIIGVIIAVVLGLAAGTQMLGSMVPWLTSLMIIAGLVVGFLNVSGKETKEFLLVAVALVIVSFAGSAGAIFGGVEFVGLYLQGMFTQIMAFVVPATVVVGLKSIWALAQSP